MNRYKAMYFYKNICSGEIVDCLVTDNADLVKEKIKNGNFLFSDYEVILGFDITSDFK